MYATVSMTAKSRFQIYPYQHGEAMSRYNKPLAILAAFSSIFAASACLSTLGGPYGGASTSEYERGYRDAMIGARDLDYRSPDYDRGHQQGVDELRLRSLPQDGSQRRPSTFGTNDG